LRLSEQTYAAYARILREELVPALGCTEPIAIAFAAAKARETLGERPERAEVRVSGNIVKNVKGVIVPNSGGMKGIEAAVALGIVGGKAERELEVLTGITADEIAEAKRYLGQLACEVGVLKTPAKLHIEITVRAGAHSALVEIVHRHTNIVRVERDGERIVDAPFDPKSDGDAQSDRTCLNVGDILAFADEVRLEDVRDVIERQIEYNTNIAVEGLTHPYGANVGANLLKHYGDDVRNRARAAAAAGSDARMSGCDFPVVINSGSGNQGMTVSLPVIEYAKFLHRDREALIRALVCSNLVAIHQKTKIGRLSAYCGAVSAACGSGAGISYLYGGGYDRVCRTITNTLANVSGIICDGAKPSCAAKIASAVDAAILAHCLAEESETFLPGDGIVKNDVEKTIGSVGTLAAEGMQQTDETILDIMVKKEDPESQDS